jgi:hypothetical protein
MTKPKIILRLPEMADDADVFLETPWCGCWTEFTREPVALLKARLGTYLQLKPGMEVPYFGGSGATLWITEIEQLNLALADECWTAIVFEPTRSASLDAIGPRRRSLVAKHALKSGDVLTAADVEIISGGLGLSEGMLAAVLDQTLCYDLNPGEPITFGMIAVDITPPRPQADIGNSTEKKCQQDS